MERLDGTLLRVVREEPQTVTPPRGGPEPFYRRLGFLPTGEVDDGETVACLLLHPSGVGSA